MAIRTYKVTLDSKNTIAPEPVLLRQGDKTGAVVIDAKLMDNGSPVSLSGLTPMFKANTADGQAVIADSTGFTVTDSANGKFTYQVPNALSSVPGKITTAYFSFSDASGSESTFDVAFIIKKAVDITKPQAEDYITIIDGTLRSLEEKINDFNTPETFTNLAAIQSKYPNGANGIMVAADNGHKYIWANSIWTDAGVYQAVGFAEKSITAPMTNFAIKASILTDDITVKIDESLKSNIGLDFYSSTLDNPGNIIWYKVPVTGGRSYSAYYHNMPKIPTQLVIMEFKNGVSTKRYSVSGDNPTFIVDSATDYVHISIASSKADYTAVKIILSEASSNIGKNAVETDNGWEARLTKAESEIDDSLTTTTAINTATRYNYEYSENRLYVDGLEKDKYIERSNGVISDYPGWALSDYLPVEKNEIYVWSYDIPTKHTVANVYCGLFDVNMKYIGSGNKNTDTDENKALIKTDSNTAYVRISQDLNFFTSNNAMLIRKALYDQVITEFIPFKRYLKNSPTKKIEEKTNSFDTNYQPNYDNVVRSIQRIGAGMEHPIHSIEAFKDAYRKGFRILLCDLIFTSDDVPVCNHDSYLNENYKNVYDSNGVLVSTDNPVYFSQNTYAELSKYNYGAMGYPLLKFTDMLKLVKQLGVEIYVEVKGMTEQQAKIACDLVRKFGLSDKTSWAGGTKHLPWVIANLDTARVALMPSDVTDDVIEELNSLKTGKNKVFIFGWDTTILTDETVNKLIQNDIAFEQGTPNTEQDIKDYFAKGDQYYYCTGIETNAVIAGKVMLESSLSL